MYDLNNPLENKKDGIVRVLILTDTHLTLKNPSNRVKMIEEGIDTFKDILNIVSDNNVDVVIHMGDLYDRGYKHIPQDSFVDQINIMKTLSDKVNGNTYMVMGNHPYSYSIDNPEFVISEFFDDKLNEIYKFKEKLDVLVPIWKCPSYLDIGTTRLNFIHFDPQKRYKTPENNMQANIGLYHDDFVTFQSKEELYHHKYGHGVEVSQTDAFENIDTAIIGHIHVPMDDFMLTNSKNTDIIIPGALVNRTTNELHEYVDLPIIDINTSGEIMNEDKLLPYKIEKFRYYLPKYLESFIDDKVKENKQMYEFAKLIKETKIKGREITLLDEYLRSLKNPKVSELIKNADTLNQLESQVLYDKYRKAISESQYRI